MSVTSRGSNFLELKRGHRVPQRESRMAIDRSSAAIDIWLTAIPFAAILFNRGIGPLTPLLVMATTPAYVLLRYERVWPLLVKVWPVLLLPIFCLTSAFWSEAPAATLRYGVFYLLTVLPAVFIGGGLNRDSVLKGLQISVTAFMLCSILFGRWVMWADGGQAFAGIAGSKNAAGDAAAMSLLISTGMIFWAFNRRKLIWGLIACGTIAIALFCLIFAKATGVMIASGLALPCMILWAISRRLAPEVRATVFIVAAVALAVLLATYSTWMRPLFEMVLENSGKDAGLTGRVALWEKADQLIALNPVLGTGYNAFWISNNLDAEYLWRSLGVNSGAVFNFHNTFRDILVDLGFVGLALFGIVALTATLRLFYKVMVEPNFLGILCCTLVVFQLPRLNFEMIGFSNMHTLTLLIFIVFGYAFRPTQLPAVGAR